MTWNLIEEGRIVSLLVEKEAFEGVRKIAEVVAEDICLVTGKKPEVKSESTLTEKRVILAATLDHSALLSKLEAEGKISLAELRGKRECYRIAFVEAPFEGVDSALVIAGSDKRGTIYGLFALSEYLGVTPLVYLGDSAPAKCADPKIGEDIETLSKEPSVRFRGFFINDEWPCFGNWTLEHFGGVNAKAYDKIFQFLLRMKGNYMWPAMWASRFPCDGPGSANEELADMYGVVMGYSHHEPCLRASEEWDDVRGEGTRYGNAWNFYTNEQGLLNYWTDSLKRSGKYENIITIGMRGERDSSMLGDHSTVEENVNLLKDIIRKQRQLIREHVNPDLSQVPQMLALYKEVEAYFYGDEHVAGLKDWEELDGVICMLCEDNFGHMRTLPTPEIRDHKGGFGMYYHFDYHGGPISYEWVDSTPLSKTWEQMTTAYEYGVRDLWIVNVGDLKFHEVPLTYFMALAYDFDKWGTSNPDSYKEYAALWAKTNFPQAKESTQEKLATLLTSYIEMNHMRRPESLNENIYHPCNYLEADKMLAWAEEVETLDCEIRAELPASELDGYISMVGFSAAASANLLKMHLYAGKSTHYAKQGRPVANRYADLAEACIEKDLELADSFGKFKDGKWNGMQLASHIGFTKWNDDGCRYPVISRVRPIARPRLSLSRKDAPKVCFKNYGGPDRVLAHDFCDAGVTEVIIELSNDGCGSLNYTVKAAEGEIPAWLTLSSTEGTVTDLTELKLTCDRSKLPAEIEKCLLLVSDGDTTAAVDVWGMKENVSDLPAMTFLPQNGVFVMNAEHYAKKKDVSRGSFTVIRDYGKYRNAVKVLPATSFFTEEEDKPELTYRFCVPEEGIYQVKLMAAPTNPAVNNTGIYAYVKSGAYAQKVALVEPGFQAGANWDPNWNRGVLDQIHVGECMLRFEKGVNELTIGALEAGLVLERIVMIPDRMRLADSYFGPDETAFTE
ncbi:MAG: glycosyl hydrolase 115 family protein [Acetatifactor sp.]|nr:glycosyl hydrolase 115 family protein [Acetatifactor sp.]